MSWDDDLQPASWRGLPFAVVSSAQYRGRRVAVHEYPFRDDVWVEDLGLAPRRLQVAGFLVGDDVHAQRAAMLAACAAPGPGELVHPSLGSLNVALVAPPAFGESAERGRMISVEFDFLETGDQLYPDAADSTGDLVDQAADEADDATSSDFLSDVRDAVATGVDAVNSVVSTVHGYVALAQGVVSDASCAFNAVRGLAGSFGRFNLGHLGAPLSGASKVLSGVNGALSTVSRTEAAVGRLIGAGVAARNAVEVAASDAQAIAAAL